LYSPHDTDHATARSNTKGNSAAYGFQIVKELRELSGGFFDLKEGTLYPALRRLEERGFVESHWVEPESGVPRKYYKITERGRRALEEAINVWDRMAAGTRRVLEAAR